MMLSNHFICYHPFLLLLSIFPRIWVFPKESVLHVRWTDSSQSTGASASASVFPMNIHGLFPLGLTGWISLQSKGLSRVFSSTTVQKHQFFSTQSSLWSALTSLHDYRKTIALTVHTLVSKVMSLLFNTLSRFVIAFLPRNNHLLISRLQSPSAMILEPKRIKLVIVSTFPPSICHEVMGPDAMILAFLMSFKSSFFTLLCHSHQEVL